MKNTLENKIKFFAQYWGQKVACFKLGLKVGEFTVGFNNQFTALCDKPEYGWYRAYLELRSINQMTLDEGQKFMETFFKFSPGCEVYGISVTTGVCFTIRFKYVDNEEGDEDGFGYSSVTIDAEKTSYEYIDWLRFHGFATAWMGLEIPKLIEYGWIKLKD